MQLGPQLQLFTLLLMQPIRIYPHTRLASLAKEVGIIQKTMTSLRDSIGIRAAAIYREGFNRARAWSTTPETLAGNAWNHLCECDAKFQAFSTA